MFCKAAGLRGFARAVNALKGNKAGLAHASSGTSSAVAGPYFCQSTKCGSAQTRGKATACNIGFGNQGNALFGQVIQSNHQFAQLLTRCDRCLDRAVIDDFCVESRLGSSTGTNREKSSATVRPTVGTSPIQTSAVGNARSCLRHVFFGKLPEGPIDDLHGFLGPRLDGYPGR